MEIDRGLINTYCPSFNCPNMHIQSRPTSCIRMLQLHAGQTRSAQTQHRQRLLAAGVRVAVLVLHDICSASIECAVQKACVMVPTP